MKTLFKAIEFIYMIIAFILLVIIGVITYPARKFLQWYFMIDEDWLEQSPDSDFVNMQIRRNKRINLDFLYRWNDKVMEKLNNKINE